jgi:anti-sigma B factor antagonist
MSDSGHIQVGVTFANGSTGQVAFVAPVGDIGTHEAPSLRNAIKGAYEKKPTKVVVDLAGVAYMATAGLATLVEALQLAKKNNVQFVLCGLQERVLAVFEISRLASVFKIVMTRAET